MNNINNCEEKLKGELKDVNSNENKINGFISFSEVSENGEWKEASGYFQKISSNKSVDERVEELKRILNKK